jgi:hypothetical protein
MGVWLLCRMAVHWCHINRPTQGASASHSNRSGYEPWMPAMFKLQVVLLAKMQWDVRRHSEDYITDAVHHTWPTPGLPGAVSQLVSPCVAGDLLQQRAPGLVPYFYTHPRLVYGPSGGLTPAVVEENFPSLPPDHLGFCLIMSWICVKECTQAGKVFDTMGEHRQSHFNQRFSAAW